MTVMRYFYRHKSAGIRRTGEDVTAANVRNQSRDNKW